MDTRRELANKIGKLNWNDIIDDPSQLSIEFLWRIYADSVFQGKQVGRTQYAETKQAFFIGFNECFKLVNDMAERLPEDQAAQVLSRIYRESADFMDNVLDRKFKGAPPV